MFLLGGATTGLWLASTGLVQLERRFVMSLAGDCSFCIKRHHQVGALVGRPGRAVQICDECVSLCCDILAERHAIDLHRAPRVYAPASVEDEQFQERVGELLRRLAEEREARRTDALLGDLRRSFDPGRLEPITPIVDFHCSFCDAPRRDVLTLISGPRVFICDGCVGEATAVVSHVLRGA